MTGLPGGLADAIARQLERQLGSGAAAARRRAAAAARPRAAAARGRSGRARRCRASRSISSRTHAGRGARRRGASGIPAAFMVAPGGARVGLGPAARSGTPTAASRSNLFGIKAGAGWNGPVAEITTTEYVDGAAQKVTAKFRAYASYDGVVPRLRQADEGQPALRRRRRPGAQGAASAASAPASRRACSAPATPPTRPTPTSWRASSTRRCACRERPT